MRSPIHSAAFGLTVLAADDCSGCGGTGGETELVSSYTIEDNTVWRHDAANVVPDLYVAVDAELLDRLGGASDEELLLDLVEAGDWGAASAQPFTVYLGLSQGETRDTELMLVFDAEGDEDTYQGLVDLGLDPWDVYSAGRLVYVSGSDECGIQTLSEVSAESVYHHAELSGGSCAVLAIAHSLVRKMGKKAVDEDGVVETDADGDQTWDPDFLEEVFDASGDTDTDLGLTESEVGTAHTTPGDSWNDGVSVSEVGSSTSAFDSGSDGALACASIQARCGTLATAVDSGDDILLAIDGTINEGFTGAGDDWGHLAPVEKATYTAGPPCCCTIETTSTSVQEPSGSGTLEDIPFAPGTSQYQVCNNGGSASVGEDEFGDSTITGLSWRRFAASGGE